MTRSGSVVRRLSRGLRRAVRLRPREQFTTVHVVAVMTVVEMLVRWVPLPRLSRMLGVRVDLDAGHAGRVQLRASELPDRARRQLRCTRRVAREWPFGRGPCLRESLVLGHLLRRHNPALRLGMVDRDESLLAHAWVEIDGRPLEPIDAYTVFHRVPSGIAR